jgi:hypothetical protein
MCLYSVVSKLDFRKSGEYETVARNRKLCIASRSRLSPSSSRDQVLRRRQSLLPCQVLDETDKVASVIRDRAAAGMEEGKHDVDTVGSLVQIPANATDADSSDRNGLALRVLWSVS